MKNEWHILGLMSGSSLDGIDLAAVRFELNSQGAIAHWQITAATTIPYPQHRLAELQAAPSLSGQQLWKLHQALGSYYGEQCQVFIADHGLKIDAIASHGHTIFHEPADNYTCQIGCGGMMAAQVSVPVITDFRSTDIAAGGQGAPLAPLADEYLFPTHSSFLNLGGIANLSIKNDETYIAYDITGCNQWLNYFAQKCQQPFDQNGDMARQGTINRDLLEYLSNWTYYSAAQPKSLSNQAVLSVAAEAEKLFQLSVHDMLATFTEHIAISVASAFQENNSTGPIVTTGGGAHNAYLIEKINNKLSSGASIYLPDARIIDFKEAALMALAGLFRCIEKPIFNHQLTGARKSVSGGAIYLA